MSFLCKGVYMFLKYRHLVAGTFTNQKKQTNEKSNYAEKPNDSD